MRQQDQVGQRRSDIHPQTPARSATRIGEKRVHFVDVGEHLQRAMVISLALVGDGHLARGALKQLDPQVRFEILDQLGDGGPRYVQAVSGFAEAARFGDPHEHAQREHLIHSASWLD
jgi:hypothetical protein